MSNPTLFICTSCNTKSDQSQPSASPDGTKLLNQLQTLHQTWAHRAELEIREVGCLWTCSRPCSVAFSSANKATYLFTKVPSIEAEALLQFGQLYLTSKDGNIPWKHFPEVLQSAEVAKIPSFISDKT
jgi:predicted metal-binding protein